jgi:hypothetical protein
MMLKYTWICVLPSHGGTRRAIALHITLMLKCRAITLWICHWFRFFNPWPSECSTESSVPSTTLKGINYAHLSSGWCTDDFLSLPIPTEIPSYKSIGQLPNGFLHVLGGFQSHDMVFSARSASTGFLEAHWISVFKEHMTTLKCSCIPLPSTPMFHWVQSTLKLGHSIED